MKKIIFSVLTLCILFTLSDVKHSQAQLADDLARIMMAEGELMGRACVCIPSIQTEAEGKKMGKKYAEWYLKRYDKKTVERALGVWQSFLVVGANNQQKQGKRGCDQVIPNFRKLANAIGYQVPR